MLWLNALQLVEQVDNGPILTKRYFASPTMNGSSTFAEVGESYIRDNGLRKINSYKNFKSASKERFYELNVYTANPSSNKPVRSTTDGRQAEKIDL